MSATKKGDLTLYHRFRAEIGVSTAELQERFAQEVKGLTHAELRVLKANDFAASEGWSEAARAIYTKMLARAAVKAKRQREAA
ncbi:MAG: hypothetical protein ACR2JW_02010 [Thermomicrobiales bacterium]